MGRARAIDSCAWRDDYWGTRSRQKISRSNPSKSTVKTNHRLLATPSFAVGVLFVVMSASTELRAQAETKPEAPTPAETETNPATAAESTVTDETMIKEIKKHAERCSEAQMKMDFDKILPYVPKKLLELMGGPEVLRTKLVQGNAELKRRGVTIDAATIGTPEKPQKHVGVIASLVPMTTKLTTPQGKLVATSHMIAISEDKGSSWVFVDTATVNEEKLGTLYPELKGKIKIPPATAKMAE
jgi:hypothetical protein